MDTNSGTIYDGGHLEDQADSLRRLVRGLVRPDRVEDLVQDSLLALVSRNGPPPARPRAWLAAVARNLRGKLFRSETRRASRELAVPPSETAPSPFEVVMRVEERRRVLALLRDLSEPYRTAIWLRFFEDLPPREIARRQSVPVETVKSRLKRGLARLREGLGGGDGRKNRFALLLPLSGGARPWLLAGGGVAMKKTAVVVLVLVLLLATGVGLVGLVGGNGRPATPELPGEPPPADSGTEPAAVHLDSDPAGPVAEDPETARDLDERAEEAAAADAPGEPEVGETARGPAVVKNPLIPALPEGVSVKPTGGFGPTGAWSRFPPAKPKGRAILVVTVVDEDDAPVSDATVYLGPPSVAGSSAVSFGDLFEVGKTGPDGTIRRENAPEGDAVLAANLPGLLMGPRGLDVRSGQTVVLRAGRETIAEIRLPVRLSSLGSIRGQVVGEGGLPVARVSVTCGFRRVWTDEGGGFRIENLPEGPHTVSVSGWSYLTRRSEVEVRGGTEHEIEITLPYKEGGSLSLTGTVLGPSDEPMPEANVYLYSAVRNDGFMRSARTDAEGWFVFDQIPDRFEKAGMTVQADRRGYRTVRTELAEGLKQNSISLKLPVRLVRVVIRAVDASTGEPLDRLLFRANAPGAEDPSGSFSSSSESGTYETHVEAGKYEFHVEAPDHAPLVREVDVPAGGDFRLEFPVALDPIGTEAVEIALRVRLTSDATGEPIESAEIEILTTGADQALARFEGEREGGEFGFMAPSGKRRIRIRAGGFRTLEEPIDLDPAAKEVSLEFRLLPE